MSAAEERFDAELPQPEAPASASSRTRALPTEGRRALVATALGAGLGLLAAMFSRRDETD